jgi:hypothetical protein
MKDNGSTPIVPMAGTGITYIGTKGLTKLEHFAGLAMQGHLAGDLECIATAKQVATASVEYARALLAELEKQQ